MDLYLLVKTLHIVSATIVFRTGIGIASVTFFGHRSGSAQERAFAACMTVKADFIFTLPSVIVQPVTGALLIWQGGFLWDDCWLVLTYGLYLLAGACWVPVVLIQMRMKTLIEAKLRGEAYYARIIGRLAKRRERLGIGDLAERVSAQRRSAAGAWIVQQSYHRLIGSTDYRIVVISDCLTARVRSATAHHQRAPRLRPRD